MNQDSHIYAYGRKVINTITTTKNRILFLCILWKVSFSCEHIFSIFSLILKSCNCQDFYVQKNTTRTNNYTLSRKLYTKL